jgi:CheY-like chemotaxis protein
MIHIAYIESDKHSLFTFEQIAVVLRARGFDNQLHVFSAPDQALEMIPLERPDIVFLDLRTYEGRRQVGLDLARALRNHPLCKRTAVVGMAEYAMPADRTAALSAGCHDFLPKPARYQAIEEIIIQLVLQPAAPTPFRRSKE